MSKKDKRKGKKVDKDVLTLAICGKKNTYTGPGGIKRVRTCMNYRGHSEPCD